MTLDVLLKNHSDTWTLASLAEAAGCDRITLGKLLRKRGWKEKRWASPYLALRIERATKGLVTAEEVPMTPRARALVRSLARANGAA